VLSTAVASEGRGVDRMLSRLASLKTDKGARPLAVAKQLQLLRLLKKSSKHEPLRSPRGARGGWLLWLRAVPASGEEVVTDVTVFSSVSHKVCSIVQYYKTILVRTYRSVCDHCDDCQSEFAYAPAIGVHARTN
jgi:hypothetical protein